MKKSLVMMLLVFASRHWSSKSVAQAAPGRRRNRVKPHRRNKRSRTPPNTTPT